VKPGDIIIMSWDFARLVAESLRRLVPRRVFDRIRGAYFSGAVEAKANNLTRRIDKLDFDIAHLAIQDSLVTNLPFIYHPHDLQHLHYPDYFDVATISHRETHWRSLAVGSSRIICASEFVKTDLKERWGISDAKIEILPMPTPDPLEVNYDKATENQHSIICIANFWPHKNQSTLIQAAHKLIGLFPQLSLTFVGDGPTRPECERLAKTLGLQDNLLFLGNVPQIDLERLLGQINVVCVPTEFEAASFPVIEGMKFGKSVIASSIGPFEEIRDSGITIYGEPKDHEALARAIRKTFEAPRLTEGQRRANEKYLNSISTEVIGRRLIDIYKSVIRFSAK
jgi:glycosyltransferase involved in cell wall biosynthesis